MNLVKTIEQYNEDFVYFCDPIKNNIMNEGNFIRIIYSTPLVVLNGIYIQVNISYTNIDKYYNKFKCLFDVNQYKETIEVLKRIEEGILKKVNIEYKTPQYKLYDQLKNGNIKVFSETFEKISNVFLLKIAGIWETEYEYGLTYKFMNI
jgi:hypothetical protein